MLQEIFFETVQESCFHSGEFWVFKWLTAKKSQVPNQTLIRPANLLHSIPSGTVDLLGQIVGFSNSLQMPHCQKEFQNVVFAYQADPPAFRAIRCFSSNWGRIDCSTLGPHFCILHASFCLATLCHQRLLCCVRVGLMYQSLSCSSWLGWCGCNGDRVNESWKKMLSPWDFP